jgi:thioredoxin reductase (NADPH)
MARAYNQAQKFGVEMAIPDQVDSLQDQAAVEDGRFLLTLANQERVRARAVVIGQQALLVGYTGADGRIYLNWQGHRG